MHHRMIALALVAAGALAAATQPELTIDAVVLTPANRGVETADNGAWLFSGEAWLDLDRADAPAVAGQRTLRFSGRFTSETADGVIVAHGGNRHGIVVYLQDRALVFSQVSDWTRSLVRSPPLGPGDHTFAAIRHTDGRLELTVDGGEPVVGTGPILVGDPGDSLQVGADLIQPVGEYEVPNAFHGQIRDLTISCGVFPEYEKRPLAALGRPAASSRAPNVVVVFIDDMGWTDLACFGGTRAPTPQIDQLAAEGIRFTQFYVNSPICSPSRVALTTGQYPQRWRISSYLASRGRNRARGVANWLDPAAPVLARQLRDVGYVTGHFGKWHMGGQRDVGEAPLITAYGFDRSLTNFEGLGPRVLPLCDAYAGKPPRRHDLGSARLRRGPIRWEDRSQITAAFVKDALAFIDEARKAGRPFYLNLWPDDVHSPFFPPEALRRRTDGGKRALYYAVLEAMDSQLGILFERLRRDPELRETTLVLLASDNGHEPGAGSSDPLRGGKTWLHEGGIRSPLVAWGPGLLPTDAVGTVNHASVFCALDVNRSLYSLTDAPLPAGTTLDGEDLLDVLLGQSRRSRSAPIFWRRPPDRPGTKEEDNPDLATRQGPWKYTVNLDGSNPCLYNLTTDVAETQNLVEEHPDVVRHLHSAVTQWNTTLPEDAVANP